MGKTRNLNRGSASQFFLGTGLSYKVGTRDKFSFGAGIGQSFILSSLGGSNYKIDKANITSISISGDHDLFKMKKGFYFNSTWMLGGLLPSSQSYYKTKLGHFYSLGLGSNYNLKGKTLSIKTSYTKRQIMWNFQRERGRRRGN